MKVNVTLMVLYQQHPQYITSWATRTERWLMDSLCHTSSSTNKQTKDLIHIKKAKTRLKIQDLFRFDEWIKQFRWNTYVNRCRSFIITHIIILSHSISSWVSERIVREEGSVKSECWFRERKRGKKRIRSDNHTSLWLLKLQDVKQRYKRKSGKTIVSWDRRSNTHIQFISIFPTLGRSFVIGSKGQVMDFRALSDIHSL